jgi:hypothetical protein
MMRNAMNLALMLSFAACGAGNGWVDSTDEALDSNDIGSGESAILVTSAESAAGATTEGLVASAAQRFSERFQPAGCAVATTSGNVVSYTLRDCTGPRGLVHVTGAIQIAYTRTATGHIAKATASKLLVEGATIDLDATSTVVEADARTATVEAHSSGIGPRGRAIERSGSYEVSWDSSCMTLEGTWSTTIGLLRTSTRVEQLRKCTGMCPSSGTVRHEGLRDRTLTISFDGSNSASWSGSDGKSGTVELDCKG